MFLDARMLSCFCAAAEELHFARAAARMHMSQPPFSQQIRKLEERVGTPLFARTTRSVRLTPAGEVMYLHAAALGRQSRSMLEAVRHAASGQGGTLTIGVAPTVAYSPLAEALYAYRAAHPGVHLELREMNSSAMEAMLRSRTIHAGLMRPLPMDADIASTDVYREPLMLAIRREHPLAAHRSLSLAKVAQLPLIGYAERESPYFRSLVHAMFRRAGLRPNIVQESVIPTILTLVQVGAGAAIVPRSLAELKGESLAYVALAGRQHASAAIAVAALKDAAPSALIAGFLAAMHRPQRSAGRGG